MKDKALRFAGNLIGVLIVAACLLVAGAFVVAGIRLLLGALYG